MIVTSEAPVEKRLLKVGDILAAQYTYGSECLSWRFFMVMKTTETSVQLQQLESQRVYEDGKNGPHYYCDPYTLMPVYCLEDGEKRYKAIGKPFRRKVYYTSHGVPKVKPEEFFTAYGVWDGSPLEGYNYH